MNKLTAMNTFVQIVDSGSLTKAAEALDTSLPTVVRTLANLETHLKARLLNRTTRSFTLTDEGRLYLERCRRILFEVEESELELNALQAKPSGKVSVTASNTFGAIRLAPLVNRFLRENDQMQVQLMMNDRNVNLVEEGVDVAVRIGKLSDSSMIARRVGSVRRLVVTTAETLANYKPVLAPEDLAEVPSVQFSGFSQGNSWPLTVDGAEQQFPVAGQLNVNHVHAAIDAVKAGMGYGLFLSYQVDKELSSGEFLSVLEEYEPEPIPIHIVYPHAKLMSTRVRVFVEWLTLELRKEFEG